MCNEGSVAIGRAGLREKETFLEGGGHESRRESMGGRSEMRWDIGISQIEKNSWGASSFTPEREIVPVNQITDLTTESLR